MSGNVCSDVQTSQILPAYNEREVNGFTELDGRPIGPGDLQQKTLDPMWRSKRNDHRDKKALQGIYHLLQPGHGVVRADEQTTVYCIEHLRTKGTRQAFPSPVIRHGWLLIGDQGQVHFEEMVNESSVSYKMMALAKAVLTCERSNPVNILKIENGKMTFAHEDLRAHMESRGLACQFPVGELVDSEIEGGSDRPEVR